MKKSWLKKVVTVGTVVFLAAAIGTTSVSAASPNVGILGGKLGGGSIDFSKFDPVKLNGEKQTTTAKMSIDNIVDARGNGYGWHLSLTMSPFTTSFTPRAHHTLPKGSLETNGNIIVKKKDDTSSEVKQFKYLQKGNKLDKGNPVTLISAPRNGGMGSYTMEPLEVKLTIPANAYSGIYTSKAIVELTSGP